MGGRPMMPTADIPKRWAVWLMDPTGKLQWVCGENDSPYESEDYTESKAFSADQALQIIARCHLDSLMAEDGGPPVWSIGMMPYRNLVTMNRGR